MDKTLFRLLVVPGHRYDELSVATKKGKVWIGKVEAVTLGSNDLLEGEAFKIRRYRAEGRMIVEEMEAEEPIRAQPNVNVDARDVLVDAPDYIPASTAALRLADEYDVDLALVEGTGKDGRVIFKDVEDYLDAGVFGTSSDAA